MKSEKAKKFLRSKKIWSAYIRVPQYVIGPRNAKKAVEIAEAEMRGRAIEAFRSVHCANCKCEWNCSNSFGCNDYDAFIQQLDKQKQE